MRGFFNQLLRINFTKAFHQQEGMIRKADKLPQGDAKGLLPTKGLGCDPLPPVFKMVKFLYSKEWTCGLEV
jgi:hypothetical protein